MMKQIILASNSTSNSKANFFPQLIQAHLLQPSPTESCTVQFDKQMRLDKLPWDILFEINLITLTCKRDYGFTAQEISDRFKAKGRKACGLRKVEEALQELHANSFIRKTTRKYPTLWGREKFKGCYRELTDIGIEFIKFRLEERIRIRKEISRADLRADQNAREPYSHVASEPTSRINLKINRSNLDSSVYVHRTDRSDFANACFEEYASQLSNGPRYIEQEAVKEEVYEPVLPKHRVVVKKLLDESDLENERKVGVIQAIVRQQASPRGIISISGITKKFIADERMNQKTKLSSRTYVEYIPPPPIPELTDEEKQMNLKKWAELIKFIKKLN